jgi:hypothetical protein
MPIKDVRRWNITRYNPDSEWVSYTKDAVFTTPKTVKAESKRSGVSHCSESP